MEQDTDCPTEQDTDYFFSFFQLPLPLLLKLVQKPANPGNGTEVSSAAQLHCESKFHWTEVWEQLCLLDQNLSNCVKQERK